MIKRFLWWVKDTHRWPHYMKDGGCYCACEKCVKYSVTKDMYVCICPRCNETCTSFGRIGKVETVIEERTEGHPYGGKAASDWYRE